ncbi:hypothetical protein Rhopal_000530-T1 [Rhodotorula paludigena]|uniref:DUF2470 domain-containing protein n=1 Tax=Rhodotorula paludigena TaxID=86838 RepID=A0AAV5G528_9BASI|nr:hypothetical protein Rhopal_000530-T1 [Rhodotorula paludigena]
MAQISEAEASRIVSHMNGEHEESLGYYLAHFARLPSSLAYAHPQITSFSSPAMKIAYGPANKRREWTYEFDPPMHAGEARKRLEQMHQDAKVKLGITDAVVDRVILSGPAYVGLVGMLALTYFLITVSPARLASFLPWQGQLFAPLLSLAQLPATKAYQGRAIKTFWLALIYAAHVLEVPACLEPLLVAYNVKKPAVRWMYRFLVLWGGFPVWTSLRDAGKAAEAQLSKSH